MFKANDKETRMMSYTSFLPLYIINFERILDLFLVFLLMTLEG